MEDSQQYCRNCRAPVTGEYCASCGQREGRADKRFLDLAGELLGDVFDMDSRFWRTLACLLLRPGFLSAEFIAGRRARYLPPLRLYLVISFVVFLLMSMGTADMAGSQGNVVTVGSDDAVPTVDTEQLATAAADPNDWNVDIGVTDEHSPQWMQDTEQRIEQNALKLRNDPNQFVEVLVDYLPQMMFLLLPLFALLIQLMYLGSAFHYLQHLVFSLHYHSFVYLLYLVGYLLEITGLHLDGWLVLGLMVYLPLALRRTYDSSWRGAAVKSVFVYFSYGFMLIFGFAAIAVLALFLI